MKDKENFYQKLKLQLDDTTKFPSDYLYKFIVPASDNRVNQVRQISLSTPQILAQIIEKWLKEDEETSSTEGQEDELVLEEVES